MIHSDKFIVEVVGDQWAQLTCTSCLWHYHFNRGHSLDSLISHSQAHWNRVHTGDSQPQP